MIELESELISFVSVVKPGPENVPYLKVTIGGRKAILSDRDKLKALADGINKVLAMEQPPPPKLKYVKPLKRIIRNRFEFSMG